MHKIIALLLVAIAIGVGSHAALHSGDKAEVLIEVDPSTNYQVIDGFGTSVVVGFEGFARGHFDQVVPKAVTYKLTARQQDEILTTAVRELGVSHARIWIWPTGIETENDNDDPAVMDWKSFTWAGQSGRPTSDDFLENRRNGIVEWGEFLRKAVGLGLVNWIPTPDRMPDWLTLLVKENDPRRFDEYAEWAAVHLLYLKKNYGLEAPYWSMFNEPDVSAKGWKTPEVWIPWIRATGRRFKKEGLRTKIVFPDTAGVQQALSLSAEVLKDAEIRSYLGALAYHHYRSSGNGPQPFLKLINGGEQEEISRVLSQVTSGPAAMAELGRRYGLPSWQTETAYYPKPVKGLSEWEIGLARANEIYLELASGTAAVEGMMMFWPDAIDPRYDHTVRYEGHHIVARTDGEFVREWEVTKDTGVIFAHYARYVRPGDRRIGATTDASDVNVVAFASRVNRRTVAVLINNSDRRRHVLLHLTQPAPRANHETAFLTDAGHTFAPRSIQRVPNRPGSYRIALSGRSVCTVVWSEAREQPLPILKSTAR